jgi:hypothetical protein
LRPAPLSRFDVVGTASLFVTKPFLRASASSAGVIWLSGV